MLPLMIGSGQNNIAAPLFVDDVFSANTYIGNRATNAIINGIDLLNNGGIVWTKIRDTPVGGGSPNHAISWAPTPASLMTGALETNTNSAILVDTGGTSGVTALANGYSLSTDTVWSHRNYEVGSRYASWTFRKAPKFFDVVTYVGNGLADRQIPHALQITPGAVIIKSASATEEWHVWHRSSSFVAGTAGNVGKNLYRNYSFNDYLDNPTDGNGFSGNYMTPPNASTFSLSGGVGAKGNCNTNGVTYVALVFAHDDTANGLIQCGGFTIDGTGAATVNLGFEPQYLLMKDLGSNNYWQVFDTARGFSSDIGTNPEFFTGLSDADYLNPVAAPTVSGFKVTQYANTNYLYVTIRRPNKPPTSGAQVFGAVTYSGNSTKQTIQSPVYGYDLFWAKYRTGSPGSLSHNVWDKTRGINYRLFPDQTVKEGTAPIVALGVQSVDLNSSYANTNGATYVGWFLKRAVGVFDIAYWTGDGTSALIPHALGVKPELMMLKRRDFTSDWEVAVMTATNDYAARLNLTSPASVGATNTLSVGTNAAAFSGTIFNPFSTAGSTNVAYLFATKAGISKVGTYVGNGTALTRVIDCGFTSGARFVMIKRVEVAGDWFMWDYARGITTGNDPHMSANTTSADVTTDSTIDPASSGFIVSQFAATNLNVSGATYMFLAIA